MTIFLFSFTYVLFLITWKKFWIFVRDEVNWRKWLNWRFALCFLIAWLILHGWLWVFILSGIPTLRKIGLTIYGILWLPGVNESVIQIPIAVWLFKKLFPKYNHNADEFK